MGIPRFADEQDLPEGHLALRVVLKPPFSPEVCITVVSSSTGARVSAVTLYEAVHRQPQACTLQRELEYFDIDSDKIKNIFDHLKAVLDQIDQKDYLVTITDGMSFEVAWRQRDKIQQIGKNNFSGGSIYKFERFLIEICLNNVTNPLLRHNLAECGHYVGMERPDTKPPKPPLHRKTQIAILGEQEERDEFIRSSSKPQKDK